MSERKTCEGCRFWSEILAQSVGSGPIEAFCLCDDGPKAMRYVKATDFCPSWKSGHLGAIDSPPDYGERVRAAYAAEDAEPGKLSSYPIPEGGS